MTYPAALLLVVLILLRRARWVFWLGLVLNLAVALIVAVLATRATTLKRGDTLILSRYTGRAALLPGGSTMKELLRAPLTYLWLTVALGFSVFAHIDIWVASWFFDPAKSGFYLDHNQTLQFIQETLWNLSNLVVVLVLVFALHALIRRRQCQIPGRFWGFYLSLIVLGPLLLVIGILKSHWGRARPAMIEAFGGDHLFTPAWQISDQCHSNCSFVSGESAATFTAALVTGLLFWHAMPPARRRIVIGALVCLVLFGSSLRIMKGRHFLSDVIWAYVLITTLGYWLRRLFQLRSILPQITIQAIRKLTKERYSRRLYNTARSRI